jgi:hypothetical protein
MCVAAAAPMAKQAAEQTNEQGPVSIESTERFHYAKVVSD